MDRTGLGRRIKSARKDKGLTGEKLSELCNINATYLRQIEGGSKTPSLPMFVELCRQLNVSPSYLLADSLDNYTSNGTEQIFDLLKNATPTQGELIYKMIQSAMSAINDK